MIFDSELLQRLKANDEKLTSLDLSNQNLSKKDIVKLRKALQKNTHVVSLNLSGNNIDDTSACELAKIKHIKTLDLSRNKIQAEGAKALAKHETLTSLNLSHNNISRLGVELFSVNKLLTKLDLSHNKIKDYGGLCLALNQSILDLNLSNNKIGNLASASLATSTTLKTLDLSHNLISDEGVKRFEKNSSITTLNLSNNTLTSISTSYLGKNATIRSLDISHNKIGDDEAHQGALDAFTENETLLSLNISRNMLNDEDIKRFNKNTTLKKLDASYNRIKTNGARILLKSRTLSSLNLRANIYINLPEDLVMENSSLTTLDISGILCPINNTRLLFKNESIKWLSLSYCAMNNFDWGALSKNTSITTLDMSDTRFSNDGIDDFEKNSTLTHLDLSNSSIDNRSISHVIMNSMLEVLNISNTIITNNELVAFTNNTTLQTVYMNSCQLTDEPISGLADNQSIRSLYISRNQVGDLFMNSIQRNKAIVTLDASSNSIKDAGAVAISKMESLISVNLDSNQIGNRGAIALAGNTKLSRVILGKTIGSRGINALSTNMGITECNIYSIYNSPAYITDAYFSSLTAKFTLEQMLPLYSKLHKMAAVNAETQLIKNRKKADQLIAACIDNDEPVACHLLNQGVLPYGAYVRTQLGDKCSLLHVAVTHKNSKLVRLLEHHNADCENLRTLDGLTYQQLAKKLNDEPMSADGTPTATENSDHINQRESRDHIQVESSASRFHSTPHQSESTTHDQEKIKSAELAEIRRHDQVSKYFDELLCLLNSNLIAAYGGVSGRIIMRSGNTSGAFVALVNAFGLSGIPGGSLIIMVANKLDAIDTYGEMKNQLRWIDSAGLDLFTCILSRRIALARRAVLTNKIKSEYKASFKILKDIYDISNQAINSLSLIPYEEIYALIDAMAILKYMSKHSPQQHSDVSDRCNELCKHLVGRNYIYIPPEISSTNPMSLLLIASDSRSLKNIHSNTHGITVPLSTIAYPQEDNRSLSRVSELESQLSLLTSEFSLFKKEFLSVKELSLQKSIVIQQMLRFHASLSLDNTIRDPKQDATQAHVSKQNNGVEVYNSTQFTTITSKISGSSTGRTVYLSEHKCYYDLYSKSPAKTTASENAKSVKPLRAKL